MKTAELFCITQLVRGLQQSGPDHCPATLVTSCRPCPTALHPCAAVSGSLPLVQFLVDHGSASQVNASDEEVCERALPLPNLHTWSTDSHPTVAQSGNLPPIAACLFPCRAGRP